MLGEVKSFSGIVKSLRNTSRNLLSASYVHGDTPDAGLCIHALNAVYIKSMDKWIRLDARGNKKGVDAQFDLQTEKLAFVVRTNMGEADYRTIYAKPSDKLMNVLENNTDAIYMYLNCLPDNIF